MKQKYVIVDVEFRDVLRPWRMSYRESFFLPYDSMVSRRTNLRRARRYVASLDGVVAVFRCSVNFH